MGVILHPHIQWVAQRTNCLSSTTAHMYCMKFNAHLREHRQKSRVNSKQDHKACEINSTRVANMPGLTHPNIGVRYLRMRYKGSSPSSNNIARLRQSLFCSFCEGSMRCKWDHGVLYPDLPACQNLQMYSCGRGNVLSIYRRSSYHFLFIENISGDNG